MEKVPGCWEHLSMVWHDLKEARIHKSNLGTIWLGIANAYSSTPHKFISFDLCRYGVSPKWIRLVENYCKRIFSKSFSESATSAWHWNHQEIFAGRTLSIILFLAGVNIILEYSVQVKVPLFTISNIEFPLLCAFMDDLSIMSRCVKSVQIQNFFWSVFGHFSRSVFHSFWSPNFTFSVHSCCDLDWTKVQSWQILLYSHYKGYVYEHNTFFCFKSNRLTRTFIFHPFKTNYVFGLLNPNLGGGGNLPHPPPPQLVFP